MSYVLYWRRRYVTCVQPDGTNDKYMDNYVWIFRSNNQLQSYNRCQIIYSLSKNIEVD